jgi:hypothetical protein
VLVGDVADDLLREHASKPIDEPIMTEFVRDRSCY